MRSNHNLQDRTQRGAAHKLGVTEMPVEWLNTGSWRLPSGKALAEFALQAGFLAPLLFQSERFGNGRPGSQGSLKATQMRPATKHFGGGNSQ